jgi:hypothetical protein
MGAGRVRAAAIAALIGATALLLGCGESRHANQQRPNVSTRVSVTVNDREVIVQPGEIGKRAEPTQEIPQNVEHPEPPIKTTKPLDITFVAANQTARDMKLKVRGRGEEDESETIYARSPGSFQVSLPTGSYTLTAVGMPGARPAHLTVGKYRASSQNDVLLP